MPFHFPGPAMFACLIRMPWLFVSCIYYLVLFYFSYDILYILLSCSYTLHFFHSIVTFFFRFNNIFFPKRLKLKLR